MMKYVSTGKDWGVTEGCDSAIIAMLFQRLEEACLGKLNMLHNLATFAKMNEN